MLLKNKNFQKVRWHDSRKNSHIIYLSHGINRCEHKTNAQKYRANKLILNK